MLCCVITSLLILCCAAIAATPRILSLIRIFINDQESSSPASIFGIPSKSPGALRLLSPSPNLSSSSHLNQSHSCTIYILFCLRMLTYYLLILLGLNHPLVQAYKLVQSYDAKNWYESFTFETAPDPTNGFVQYVSQAEAVSMGMTYTLGTQVYLGVDNSTIVEATAAGNGRKSIWLESKESFLHGLLIGDFAHVPGSICGLWPAFSVWRNRHLRGIQRHHASLHDSAHPRRRRDMHLRTPRYCRDWNQQPELLRLWRRHRLLRHWQSRQLRHAAE